MTEPPRASWPAETFDRIYAADTDPWRVNTSDYERDKYAATLAALGQRRFPRGLEVGCSIGGLTRPLAARCEALLAVDVAEQALAIARATCAALPHVEFQRLQIPQAWPDGRFDLLVLSEVLYFLGPDDIARTAALAVGSLSPRGMVLLVNWTGPTDTPCTGEEAAARFIRSAGLTPTLQQRQPRYRLDRLERA